jgi:hypothetical protein
MQSCASISYVYYVPRRAEEPIYLAVVVGD